MLAPVSGEHWLAVSDQTLPVAEAHEWVGRPDCGATVLFTGAVRDHSEGRPGVQSLEYEAYESAVMARLHDAVGGARDRWPTLGRVVVWHRVGVLTVGDTAVVVAVAAPHRDEAFEAGRWLIDTVKATAPIWKRETWEHGTDWGTCAVPLDGQPVHVS